MQLTRTMSLIEAGLQQGLHVGAQLYVWRDGQVLADAAVGLARAPSEAKGEAGAAMTPDSVIVWLSSGKPITAVAIAQLWEKGLLDVEDPVVRFLPEFGQHGKEGVTIRHLLKHTAPLRLVETGWPAAPWEQIIARLCAARPEPRWIPGRAAGYGAHATWFILGEIVRRVSGEAIDRYARRHIFEPCGMSGTFMSIPPGEQARLGDRLAIMQNTDPQARTAIDFDSPEAIASARPSASVRGPIRELGFFYQMLLGRGMGVDGRRVLSSIAVDAMTSRHRAGLHDKTFGTIIDWGLGFILNSSIYGNPKAPYQYGPLAGPRAFGHSGSQSSTGFADPDHRLVVALVFNGMCGEAVHQQRMRDVLEAVYRDIGIE